VSGVAHGKRHRNAEEFYGDVGPAVVENYEGPPLKRVRGEASGGMEAAQSTARTRRRPETRVPTIKNNTTSKEAGRGAERLATPNAQGVYHHSLPGPSSQQGRVLTNAQGPQLPWVEERVEEASHHMANAVQQEEGHLFQIPSNFHEGYMILLAATEADWTRRAVDEIVPTVGSQNGMISSVTARPQMRIHLKSHFVSTVETFSRALIPSSVIAIDPRTSASMSHRRGLKRSAERRRGNTASSWGEWSAA
jgi:hypothetical protein